MKKSVLAIMVGALCIILSSCQETPEMKNCEVYRQIAMSQLSEEELA